MGEGERGKEGGQEDRGNHRGLASSRQEKPHCQGPIPARPWRPLLLLLQEAAALNPEPDAEDVDREPWERSLEVDVRPTHGRRATTSTRPTRSMCAQSARGACGCFPPAFLYLRGWEPAQPRADRPRGALSGQRSCPCQPPGGARESQDEPARALSHCRVDLGAAFCPCRTRHAYCWNALPGGCLGPPRVIRRPTKITHIKLLAGPEAGARP